jgi:hypothetical protein
MKRQARAIGLSNTFCRFGAPLSGSSTMALLGSCLLSLACSSGAPRDLGSSSVSFASDDQPPLTQQDLSGAWIGQAEDPLGPWQNGAPGLYQFPSGSTQIRLVIDTNSAQLVNASLTFGIGDPPPWPAVLSEGYPPTVDYTAPPIWNSFVLPPVEGYPYALYTDDTPGMVYVMPASPPDGPMKFSFNPLQWLSPWCHLQIASESPSGDYTCAGSNPGYDLTPGQMLGTAPASCHDGDQSLDCNKYYLCVGPAANGPPNDPACACSHDHCAIDDAQQMDLFLSRDGADLVGIFSNGLFARAGGTLAALGQLRLHRE